LENKKNNSSKNPSDVIDRVDEIKSKESLIRTSENIEKRGNSLGLAFRLSTELATLVSSNIFYFRYCSRNYKCY